MNSRPLSIHLALQITCLAVFAAPGLKPDGSLDMPAIQTTYRGGELEQVKTTLESYLKSREAKATREEKIFAYKYLGVIHAAEPGGRTRAESYFNRLFELAPHMELSGMFVSKGIQNLFDEVKREFQRNREYDSRFDAVGNPIPSGGPAHDTVAAAKEPAKDSAAQTPSPRKSEGGGGSKKLYWWAGGFAAVAATGAVLWLSLDGEEKAGKNLRGTIEN